MFLIYLLVLRFKDCLQFSCLNSLYSFSIIIISKIFEKVNFQILGSFCAKSWIRTNIVFLEGKCLNHLTISASKRICCVSLNWARQIRTTTCMSQSHVPYHLAIAHYKYRQWESNPHDNSRRGLNSVCIPISPYLYIK